MSIEDRDTDYLVPAEPGAFHTFDAVTRKYFVATENPETFAAATQERRAEIAGDDFIATLLYFANRTEDPFLEELGTTAWNEIKAGRIKLTVEKDNRGSLALANRRGRGSVAYDPSRVTPNSPVFMAYSQSADVHTELLGMMVIPEGFSMEARGEPLETLDRLITQLSLIRDFANGRALESVDRKNDRADAFRSHFWRRVMVEQPDIVLPQPIQGIVQTYPQGYRSIRSSQTRYQPGKYFPQR